MKKRKKPIKPTEARILQSLARTPRPLTVNELADKSSTSWKTADTHLKKWEKKGLVIKSSLPKKFKVKKDQWTIDRSKIAAILKKKLK
ncbi:hypothetical protein LCGC14_1990010 [marine sediment metagenome]|uniref:HTH arsR-type domain-containing protein n=1 Tax=marine sediment metagenome TaxID=412755 RepID=A0A0F9HJP2_9ZZZZ